MATDLKLILDTFLSYTSVPNPSLSLMDCTTLIPFKRIHISFSIVTTLVQVTYLKNCNNVLLSSLIPETHPSIENADLVVSHPPHCSLCPGPLGTAEPLQCAALFTTGSGWIQLPLPTVCFLSSHWSILAHFFRLKSRPMSTEKPFLAPQARLLMRSQNLVHPFTVLRPLCNDMFISEIIFTLY